MKNYKAVYIEWIDSACTDPSWMSESEAIEWGDDNSNNIIRQVGFLIKKNQHTILLAHGIGTDQINGVFKIPVKCISKLTYLSFQ